MKTLHQENCPFKVGQTVVYRPSDRGIALEVMSSDSEKLTPGNAYRIEKIQDGIYVVVEGYTHPGGGIHWTEFSDT